MSCKYLSKVLQNASPARLAEGLLTFRHLDDRRDWYERVAPVEYQALYRACVEALGATRGSPPGSPISTWPSRARLSTLLDGRTWPEGTQDEHRDFCRAVSSETARIWKRSLRPPEREAMLWRLLRIGSAPYYVLGNDGRDSMRLRVDTPWDWRQNYRLERFDDRGPGVRTAPGRLVGRLPRPAHGEHREVCGHVQLRWSHGRFRQRPEAKVYLDTPHAEVPGYHPL